MKKSSPQTIVVQAKKGEKVVPEKIAEDIKNKINPTNLQVGVSSFKPFKNDSIAITCQSSKDKEILHEEVTKQLGNQYNIQVSKLQKKKIKIIGIQEKMTDEELKQSILQQNNVLNVDENCYLKILTFKNLKNRMMAIVEIDELSFNVLVGAQKLKIKWSICNVYACLNVYRCFNCYGFNHKAATCKNDSICGKCGKKKHDGSCNGEVNCVNCVTANMKFNLKLDIHHSVFDEKCNVLQRQIERQRNKIILDTSK